MSLEVIKRYEQADRGFKLRSLLTLTVDEFVNLLFKESRIKILRGLSMLKNKCSLKIRGRNTYYLATPPMIIFYCEYIPKNFITRSVISRIPKFENELKEHQSQWRSQGHCFGEASSKRRRHSRVSAPQLLHGFSRLFERSPPPPSTLTTPLIRVSKLKRALKF